MPLETATHISGLVASNPASSDGLNQADDHLRLIKQVLMTDIGVALTSQSLNVIDGSAADPSIGFANDVTTGFYRKNTGVTAVVGRLVGGGTVPIGGLIDFAGPDANIPIGFLPCDGGSLLRTDYPDLFAAIGTTWGAADATHFNIPNLLIRYRRHRDNGTTSGAVGNLQGPCNLSHTHTGGGTTSAVSNDHTHTFNANTGVESNGHTHGFSGNTGTESNFHTHPYTSASAVQQAPASGGAGMSGSFGLAATTGNNNQLHTHAFSGTTGDISATHFHGVSGTTSGISANHTHTYNFTTNGGSADGPEVRPYSATVLTCIRAF